MVLVTGSPVWWSKRRRQATARFCVFTAAAVAGGATLGYVCAIAAQTAGHRATVIVVAASAAATGTWMIRRKARLCVQRQVPSQLKGTRLIGPIVYGWVLGTAVLTYVRSETVYLYVGSLLVFGDSTVDILAGTAYGLSYALWVLALGHQRSSDDPVGVARHVTTVAHRVRPAATVGAIAAVGALILGAT